MEINNMLHISKDWKAPIDLSNCQKGDIIANSDGVFLIKRHPTGEDNNIWLAKPKDCLGLDEWSLSGGEHPLVERRDCYSVLIIEKETYFASDLYIIPYEGGSTWVHKYSGKVLFTIEEDSIACFLSSSSSSDYSGDVGIGSWSDKGYY